MNDQSEEAAMMGRQIIAETGDTKFVHICLYNSLLKTGDTKEGVDALCSIYSNLLYLHGYVPPACTIVCLCDDE